MQTAVDSILSTLQVSARPERTSPTVKTKNKERHEKTQAFVAADAARAKNKQERQTFI